MQSAIKREKESERNEKDIGKKREDEGSRKKLIAKIEQASRTRRCPRDYHVHASTFFPGKMHRDGAFGLSAIFVSNVIIPGRRPENQPDGLSPTTARSEETNGRRERKKGEEKKVEEERKVREEVGEKN